MARLQGIPDVDHEYKSLRISALRNAVQIAPYVSETTIGPNSIKNHNVSNGSQVADICPDSDKKPISPTCPAEQTDSVRNETVTYEKILHECEMKQKETADLMFHSMLNRMIAKRADMMNKFWRQQELEYEKRSQERRNREIEILQEWALGDRIAKLEQEKLDEENKAHSERMRRLLETQLESTKLFESLNTFHSETCFLYEEITTLSSIDDPLFNKILQKLEPSLTTILSSMNIVTEKCKTGTIDTADVDMAASLTSKMRNLKLLAIDELKTANEEQSNRLAQEALEKQKEASVREVKKTELVQNTIVTKTVPAKPSSVQFCSDNSINLYTELKQFLIQYENSYTSLVNDDSLKKYRFDLQKAVNIPVNAISSVSGAHLKDKYDKLLKLLSGDRVRVGDAYITCTSHPQGVAYCTDLLARKLVRQGDQLVSSNPDAAFPIASIIVALWARFPDLGKLILAHFHQDCPYLIPMMMPQCEGQTDQEFYKMRGYKYNEDGTVEKQDKFLKRMSGIFRLCAAIWVSKMPYSVGGAHPQGLAHAWRWMAAFINLDPEADISATLLNDFLTVCGSEFFKHYRGQFIKVLNFLLTGYREKIDKIDEGGPKVRLEAFLQNIIKDGSIPPPAGALPNRMW